MEVTKERPRLLQNMNSRSFSFLITSYKNRLLQCLQTLNISHKDNTMNARFPSSGAKRRAFSTPYVYARVTGCNFKRAQVEYG